jgi:aldehyde dehydrogenase (NAD+)
MNVTTMIQPGKAPAGSTIPDVFSRQQRTAILLRTSTAADRIAKLKKLETAVLSHRDAIYRALREDLRKPEAEADLAEIMPIISEIHHTAKNLKSWMRTKRIAPTLTLFGTQARIRYEPKGVCLIISPWNYPFNLTFGPLACAIGAGNTAIIKPSELTPACAAVMADIIRSAFDPSEIALFEGDAAVATELLSLPFDHIFFTGSPEVGKIVMAAAAKTLASVTLELGGKSPVIVDETADITKAANSIMWGKFVNNGQTCIAPDYLYVHEKILPEFLEKSKAAIAKMYGADARVSPDYCRMVNEKHFLRVKRLLDDATANGALIADGGVAEIGERFIAPTLLTNVSTGSEVMKEEIFGPVLPVIAYSDITEPLSHINEHPKPLALYVYSKNDETINRVITETSTGGACINMSMLHFSHPNLPFGGVNNSGIGSYHGIFGFKAFSHERAILRDRFSTIPMLFPPYTARVKSIIKLTLKYLT